MENTVNAVQCQTKWRLVIENQKIVGLMLHELPKNGASLYKVASTNAPLFIEIGKPIALSFWKDLKLDGKIDWAFLSNSVDPDYFKMRHNRQIRIHPKRSGLATAT